MKPSEEYKREIEWIEGEIDLILIKTTIPGLWNKIQELKLLSYKEGLSKGNEIWSKGYNGGKENERKND